jgi:hypothetical protein
MDHAGAAAVGCAGEEGHANVALMGDTLESADEICPLKILFMIALAQS